MAFRVTIRVPKLKNFKNDPYFTYFPYKHFPLRKNTELRVIFENFGFWNSKCDSTSHAKTSRTQVSIIGFIADILVTFPLAFHLFLKIAPLFKITDISGICSLSWGKMLVRGTARGKMNQILRPSQDIVFPQKMGHPLDYLLWSSRKMRKKTVV